MQLVFKCTAHDNASPDLEVGSRPSFDDLDDETFIVDTDEMVCTEAEFDDDDNPTNEACVWDITAEP